LLLNVEGTDSAETEGPQGSASTEKSEGEKQGRRHLHPLGQKKKPEKRQ